MENRILPSAPIVLGSPDRKAFGSGASIKQPAPSRHNVDGSRRGLYRLGFVQCDDLRLVHIVQRHGGLQGAHFATARSRIRQAARHLHELPRLLQQRIADDEISLVPGRALLERQAGDASPPNRVRLTSKLVEHRRFKLLPFVARRGGRERREHGRINRVHFRARTRVFGNRPRELFYGKIVVGSSICRRKRVLLTAPTPNQRGSGRCRRLRRRCRRSTPSGPAIR